MPTILEELASDVLRPHCIRVSHPELKENFEFMDIFFRVNAYGESIENIGECESTAIWERFVHEKYGIGDDKETLTNIIEALIDDYFNYHYEDDDKSLFNWEWDCE